MGAGLRCQGLGFRALGVEFGVGVGVMGGTVNDPRKNPRTPNPKPQNSSPPDGVAMLSQYRKSRSSSPRVDSSSCDRAVGLESEPQTLNFDPRNLKKPSGQPSPFPPPATKPRRLWSPASLNPKPLLETFLGTFHETSRSSSTLQDCSWP